MEGKCRLRRVIHPLHSAVKTKGSDLVGSAGGRTAGDMDSRQYSVRKIILSDFLYYLGKDALGIPKPHLTDSCADTSDRGLEKIPRAVCGNRKNLLRLFAVKIDKI